MNTRQKLTLGIAAIFMVTLTIVGVTYAYFVTRVTGTITESVNVQTAKVGSVIYEQGNGTSDVVTLNDILPGTTLYKSFKVTNEASDAAAVGSYTIFMESWPTDNKPQFVHGSAGAITSGATNVCYNSSAINSEGDTITGNVVSNGTPTATCFDGTSYNNVYVTLYEITPAGTTAPANYTYFNTVANDGTAISNEATYLSNPVLTATNVAAKALNDATPGNASQDLTSALTIAGNTTRYYVLKVEYRNNNANQNIENDAALTLKVSIR